MKTDHSQSMLRDYMEQVYFVKKVTNGALPKESRRFFRAAVKCLELCEGRDLRCDEVDQDMIERFTYAALCLGYTRKTVQGHVFKIKSILRMWAPDRFPAQKHESGGAVKFLESDCAGTLDEICKQRYLPENPKTASVRSVCLYALSLKLLGYYLERPATLADLNDETIARFGRWCVDVRGNKAITANGYLARIKALWNWCAKKRLVTQFPTVVDIPEQQVMPQSWTKDELQALATACKTQPGEIGKIPAAEFWTAFHLVLWDTGERTGTMLQLEWGWLDSREGFLAVPGECRKNRKPMLYRLKPATLDYLEAIRRPKRDVIFDTPFTQQTFYHHYHKLIRSAGLTYSKSKTGPQKMRRTFASFIDAAGGDATRALKHSDRHTTEKGYLDPRITETHHENERLFPLDGNTA